MIALIEAQEVLGQPELHRINLFKIQKKIIYAIEAVVDIALNSGPHPVQNEAIAKRQGIPKRYLEQTLQMLVKNRVLIGSRGPKGGYSLAKERRKIKLSKIISCVADDETEKKIFNSNLSQSIILPIISNIKDKCIASFTDISVEDICKLAKNKKIQKSNSKKVDFVI